MTKTILITGASRGIGRAILTELQRRGATPVGTSRAVAGPSSPLLTLDVTSAASVAACVETLLSRFGRIDGLVANAGYDLYGAVEDTSIKEFRDQIESNLMGVVRVVSAVLPVMRRQGSGRIAVIGSLGGVVGLPMNAAYAASKFALEGFCESLRLELAGSGISVSLIQPPAVSTDTLDSSIRRVHGRESPLARRTEAMIAAMRRAGAASRVSPDRVAERVARVMLDARAPVLRHPIGLKARSLPILKALMPQRLFEGFLRRQFP